MGSFNNLSLGCARSSGCLSSLGICELLSDKAELLASSHDWHQRWPEIMSVWKLCSVGPQHPELHNHFNVFTMGDQQGGPMSRVRAERETRLPAQFNHFLSSDSHVNHPVTKREYRQFELRKSWNHPKTLEPHLIPRRFWVQFPAQARLWGICGHTQKLDGVTLS